MLVKIIDDANVRDISAEFTDKAGRMLVVPAEQYARTTTDERALFGANKAFYGFLTTELIDYLVGIIAGRSAIEIGAGHGALAAALGIPATDNRQQEWPEVKAFYETCGQRPITYGQHVEKLDALAAIKKYKPQVVVGCWVTHKYDPNRHAAGGNQDGIDEEKVIAACETYIVVRNEKVHDGKSIWKLPHTKITPPWLYSRAHNGSPNFIAVWHNPKNLKGTA